MAQNETNKDDQHVVRMPWGKDGLPVVAHTFWDGPTQSQARSYGIVSGDCISNHPDYNKAKCGKDFKAASKAAIAVVTKALSKTTLGILGQTIGANKENLIFVAPFLPSKSGGKNMLAVTFAHILAQRFNGTVERDIVQKRRVGRTHLDPLDRILTQPAFSGTVKKDASYVLVDDVGTTGGTLATLRGFIEASGGKVICGTVLCSASRYISPGVTPRNGKDFDGLISANIAITPQQQEVLVEQAGLHGGDILRQHSGFGIPNLTRVEGAILSRLGAGLTATLASRTNAATNQRPSP